MADKCTTERDDDTTGGTTKHTWCEPGQFACPHLAAARPVLPELRGACCAAGWSTSNAAIDGKSPVHVAAETCTGHDALIMYMNAMKLGGGQKLPSYVPPLAMVHLQKVNKSLKVWATMSAQQM